jgi:hypothetical protein
VYELVPFTPEDFYFDQRYVRPSYSLSPGKGHHADLSLGINVTRTSESAFYLKKFKLKAVGTFLTNNKFYTYFSLPENVLVAHQMRITEAKARSEMAMGFAIYTSYLELGGKYEYSYFYASDYVTYQPEHVASGYIRLEVYRFEAEYSMTYRYRMNVNPFISITLDPVLTGSLSLQFRVVESLYLFGRIDNILNAKYSTVYGYPEPGRTIAGGLRIIL